MSLKQTVAKTDSIIKLSFKTLLSDSHILIYPLMAWFFTLITYPLIENSIFSHWYDRIFSDANQFAPHKTGIIIGLIGFSAFYAAFVSAIFTCAVSASVLAKLEHQSSSPLNGLWQVGRHFFRVVRFAVLSVFLFPIGLYAQRRKLPRGIAGVVGSSLTLHMSGLAPAVLTTKKRFGATVRDSIDTLGAGWKEGLLLKVLMYSLIFLFFVMPKLIQYNFFTSPSASKIGWLISLEIAASGFVAFKVLNAIFMSVLYHQARNKKNT